MAGRLELLNKPETLESLLSVSVFLHVCFSSPVRFPVNQNDCNNIFTTPLPSIRGGLSEMIREQCAFSSWSGCQTCCLCTGPFFVVEEFSAHLEVLWGTVLPGCVGILIYCTRKEILRPVFFNGIRTIPCVFTLPVYLITLRMNGLWEHRFSAIMSFS